MQREQLLGEIVGKDFYRTDSVNEGHYSKKRADVADVDPKVMEPYQPIPGKPPRKVVIDRQRKLFASLDIEELLLEFVSTASRMLSLIELHNHWVYNTP